MRTLHATLPRHPSPSSRLPAEARRDCFATDLRLRVFHPEVARGRTIGTVLWSDDSLALGLSGNLVLRVLATRVDGEVAVRATLNPPDDRSWEGLGREEFAFRCDGKDWPFENAAMAAVVPGRSMGCVTVGYDDVFLPVTGLPAYCCSVLLESETNRPLLYVAPIF